MRVGCKRRGAEIAEGIIAKPSTFRYATLVFLLLRSLHLCGLCVKSKTDKSYTSDHFTRYQNSSWR